MELKPGFQNDPKLREQRARVGGGPMMLRGLVLYWPPLDALDPQRKGEDLLWVGQQHSDIHTWEFIRRFMEKGMDAVPEPGPEHYRRKGFSSTRQHLWEDKLDSKIRWAILKGKPDPRDNIGLGDYLFDLPFLFFNTLAERMCYWPKFPEEWNSDCGQRRRESGIGPEEPLRWTAS